MTAVAATRDRSPQRAGRCPAMTVTSSGPGFQRRGP
jgi:hypothetical protein